MKRSKESTNSKKMEVLIVGAIIGDDDNPFDTIIAIAPSGKFYPLVVLKGELSENNGIFKVSNELHNPYQMIFSCQNSDHFFKNYPISMTMGALIEFLKYIGKDCQTEDLQLFRKNAYLEAKKFGLLKHYQSFKLSSPSFFDTAFRLIETI